MKKDDIYDGVTDVRDETVKDANRGGKKGLILGLAAALTACAALGGAIFWHAEKRPDPPDLGEGSAQALVRASYPQRVQYPETENGFTYDEDQWDEWYSQSWERRLSQEELDAMEGAWRELLPALIGASGREDSACSPANVYMALSMLAQTTAGDSQKQILDLLGTDSAQSQRDLTKHLWNALYNDDGTYKSLLANSLWLRDDTEYKMEALQTLAENYYASTFAGEMGSDALNGLLRDWINGQTGGLLEEQIGGISLDSETALALVSTAYFGDMWEGKFAPDRTDLMTFHGESGDYERDFMHKNYGGTYYWGDKFVGVELPFESGGTMRFLLPDEGVGIEEVLEDPMASAFLTEGSLWDTFTDNSRYMDRIILSLPKFDVTSDAKIGAALKSLGITDVFDPAEADFSPILESAAPVYVSEVFHGARVKVDEEGCEAAAYTLIPVTGAAAPPEEIQEITVTLDRPFLYSLMSGGVPMFAGCVRQ